MQKSDLEGKKHMVPLSLAPLIRRIYILRIRGSPEKIPKPLSPLELGGRRNLEIEENTSRRKEKPASSFCGGGSGSL